MKRMYRQGDVLLIDNSIPKDVKPTRSDVLVFGESSGHAHRIVGGEVFEETGPYSALSLYVRAGKSASLVHEEHETISLPEGEYRVVRQREWDTSGARDVID